MNELRAEIVGALEAKRRLVDPLEMDKTSRWIVMALDLLLRAELDRIEAEAAQPEPSTAEERWLLEKRLERHGLKR